MATGNSIPEMYQTLAPAIQTPLSDYMALPLSQQGRVCGFFEAQFYRCMEAYGAKLGRKYCDFEHRDMLECVKEGKQKKRAEAIKQQRVKLYAEGKLDAVFEENHPAPGQYKPDWFDYNRCQ